MVAYFVLTIGPFLFRVSLSIGLA